jgi:hypothetical protein
MMTRYCTSNPSLETERTALANILLKSGTSTSWIIGKEVTHSNKCWLFPGIEYS